jgi:hypothetical protein
MGSTEVVSSVMTRLTPERRSIPTARLVGLAAFAFSALYLLSDVIEAIQGGFSRGQLWLTFVAEVTIPVFVIGLYLAQRSHIGRLGQVGAFAYAYSYVYFTGTVVYALAAEIRDVGFAGMGGALLRTMPENRILDAEPIG